MWIGAVGRGVSSIDRQVSFTSMWVHFSPPSPTNQRVRLGVVQLGSQRHWQTCIYVDQSFGNWRYFITRWQLGNNDVQGGQKNLAQFLLNALTLSNINWFSKFFHCQNQQKICNNIITKDPTTPQVWNVRVLKATTENKTTSVTTHFKIVTTGNNVFIVSVIVYLTVTSCSFYIKCSMCPSCCWMTHSSWRRHWPMARSMKRCDSLPHSMTIACFSWLIVVNRRRWCWRAPQTA